MKLTIGFSPCPNDTFIFDALVNGKIDTASLSFEPVLEDVQSLNQWALEGKLDITKLSFPAYFASRQLYTLLMAGSALGKGVGPLLISAENKQFATEDVEQANVLLPGANTTAHLLFSFAYPRSVNKKFAVFHEIEDAVLDHQADLGVIIHENRFTYEDKGLFKVRDLGEYWEEKMKLPIPLGGIVIKKTLGAELYGQVNKLINQSLRYSFKEYPIISNYVKSHAQAMNEDVMRKHIDLYVNNHSLDLGADGLEAIGVLEEVYHSIHRAETNSS